MIEENSMPESNVKSAIDAATGLVKAIPVYEDAVQPSAKQIGKSLETVTKTVNIVLAPIKALVWGYEQIEGFISTRVAEKLKSIPNSNIVTPPPQVAGPAVEALRYVGHDENLRELFANLLATSMDVETIKNAHPAYVEIIKNLSSDEAKLLQAFIKKNGYAIVEIQSKSKTTNEFNIIYNSFSLLFEQVVIKNPDLLQSYIDNLCRLGILERRTDKLFADYDVYQEIENSIVIKTVKEMIETNEDRFMNLTRGVIELTSFGRQFISSVVISKNESE